MGPGDASPPGPMGRRIPWELAVGAVLQGLSFLLPQRVELLEAAVRLPVGPKGPPVDLAPGDRLAGAGRGVEGLLMALHENRAVRVHRSQDHLSLAVAAS